jgi:RNA polymerase sigma-70 factor (ECF subfamily)
MAWLVMIARGRAIDRLRARTRHTAGISLYERELVSLELEVSRRTEAEREELAGACASALHQLPEEQSHALQLAFFRGWTHQEIAAASRQPLGTIKARIRRGLLGLRQALKDYHA